MNNCINLTLYFHLVNKIMCYSTEIKDTSKNVSVGQWQVIQVIHPLLRGAQRPCGRLQARDTVRPWDFFISCPFSFVTFSIFSAYLPLFLCHISFLLFQCGSSGKTLRDEFYFFLQTKLMELIFPGIDFVLVGKCCLTRHYNNNNSHYPSNFSLSIITEVVDVYGGSCDREGQKLHTKARQTQNLFQVKFYHPMKFGSQRFKINEAYQDINIYRI